MPNILDAWMADRARGAGKVVYATAATPSTAVGLGGLIGAGTSSPPAGPAALSLMPAGTLLPPPGSAERAQFFLSFKSAVGFDGNTALHGWSPGPANSFAFSMFLFVNYGVTSIVGFTPNPNQGYFYEADYAFFPENTFPSTNVFAGTTGTNPASGLGIGTGAGGGPATSPSITWPSDGDNNSGWIPVMFSMKITGPTTGHAQIYAADTALFDGATTTSDGTSPFSFSKDVDASGNFMKWIGGNGSTFPGSPQYVNNDGAVVAVTQYVVYEGHYINWADPTIRAKFFTSDAGWGPEHVTYAPVDIGPSGSKAIGRRPTIYLTGGPTDFLYNRAQGGLKLTQYTANLSPGLFIVDDPPT